MKNRREVLTKRLIEQKLWIELCGATRSGYITRYAMDDDVWKGLKVYDADMAELKRIEEQLKNHWL